MHIAVYVVRCSSFCHDPVLCVGVKTAEVIVEKIILPTDSPIVLVLVKAATNTKF